MAICDEMSAADGKNMGSNDVSFITAVVSFFSWVWDQSRAIVPR